LHGLTTIDVVESAAKSSFVHCLHIDYSSLMLLGFELLSSMLDHLGNKEHIDNVGL
jgi:hypothetical protein